MSQTTSDQGRRDRKNLSIELNLVPFIDLLSTLVLFLLVTTVWMQISMLPIGISSQKEKSPSIDKPPPKLKLKITKTEIKISQPDQDLTSPTSIVRNGSFLVDLRKILIKAHSKNQNIVVSVDAEDEIDYGLVIQTIDTVRASGIKSSGLAME